MLTVRGKYANGAITILEEVPLDGSHPVLITFLDSDSYAITIPRDQAQEVKNLVRERARLLTRKELAVLRLAQQGLKIEEIADRLELAHGTARNALSSIYKKLGVRNRPEAIRKATELGLLDATQSIFD